MKKVIEMFISFFKIGAFTFGGGYAMIPLIEKEVVENKKWVTKEEFLDILVVAQSLPGAISINCATFIGYKIRGAFGGIVALLSIIMPSFFIMLIVATFFIEFRENYYINLMFKGISAAVPMLVLAGVISIAKSIEKTKGNAIIIILALGLLLFGINPIILIASVIVYGCFKFKVKEKIKNDINQ